MKSIEMSESLRTIGDSAFYGETALTFVEFPATIESIGNYAFSRCANLSTLFFTGDAPQIGSGALNGVKADAYYPGDNATWTKEMQQSYGGSIRWYKDTETAAMLLANGEELLTSEPSASEAEATQDSTVSPDSESEEDIPQDTITTPEDTVIPEQGETSELTVLPASISEAEEVASGPSADSVTTEQIPSSDEEVKSVIAPDQEGKGDEISLAEGIKLSDN